MSYKRWHEIGFGTKVIRWLRYRPLGYLGAIGCIAAWIVTGARNVHPDIFGSRWEILKSAWMVHNSMADYRMGRWWTMDEMIADLRATMTPEELASYESIKVRVPDRESDGN